MILLIYHWEFPFFGLREEYKLAVHEECFTLGFYGRGTFSFTEAYNLPIHLRKFFLRKLEDEMKKEAEAKNKKMKGKDKLVRPPSFGTKIKPKAR